MTCYNCQQKGHYANACPQAGKQPTSRLHAMEVVQGDPTSASTQSTMLYTLRATPEKKHAHGAHAHKRAHGVTDGKPYESDERPHSEFEIEKMNGELQQHLANICSDITELKQEVHTMRKRAHAPGRHARRRSGKAHKNHTRNKPMKVAHKERSTRRYVNDTVDDTTDALYMHRQRIQSLESNVQRAAANAKDDRTTITAVDREVNIVGRELLAHQRLQAVTQAKVKDATWTLYHGVCDNFSAITTLRNDVSKAQKAAEQATNNVAIQAGINTDFMSTTNDTIGILTKASDSIASDVMTMKQRINSVWDRHRTTVAQNIFKFKTEVTAEMIVQKSALATEVAQLKAALDKIGDKINKQTTQVSAFRKTLGKIVSECALVIAESPVNVAMLHHAVKILDSVEAMLPHTASTLKLPAKPKKRAALKENINNCAPKRKVACTLCMMHARERDDERAPQPDSCVVDSGASSSFFARVSNPTPIPPRTITLGDGSNELSCSAKGDVVICHGRHGPTTAGSWRTTREHTARQFPQRALFRPRGLLRVVHRPSRLRHA